MEPIRTYEDIGREIRKLRRSRKLTGAELGKRAKISQSKISKIENGAIRLEPKDTSCILDILECPQIIRQQIFAVFELDSHILEYRYRAIRDEPHAVYKRESTTQFLRCFTFNVPPVLLQTALYHEAQLASLKLHKDEISQMMAETVQRQDLLWEPSHSFHFLMTEIALYTAFDRRVQIGQLDRLYRICGLRRVKLGIIPLKSGLLATENTNFVVYDNKNVRIMTPDRELSSDDPEDVAEHVKIFTALSRKAHYDNEAQSLITNAITYFT